MTPSQRQSRVLFVTTIPLTLTSFLLPFAEQLKSQGVRVDCASLDASSSAGLEIFDHCFDVSWGRTLGALRHSSHINKQLFAIFDQGAYDIVHVHTPIAAYMTRRALASWKHQNKSAKPTVFYTAHGFHFYQGQKSLFKQAIFSFIERHALPWTDVIITMNEEDERAAKALRAAAKRPVIKRIDGVGFDFASYQPLKKAHIERDAQPFVMTIIAEHNENKSHELLFQALALLTQQNVTNWTLNVVGSGPLTQQIIARAQQLGIEQHVVFHGQVSRDALEDIIRESDMGLLVSKREGLPRSLMELCAGGVLIAGTSTRGIRDEVRDPRALALKRTPSSLAAMIDELMHDKPLRLSIAQQQYDYARAHFDLPLILDEYNELYSHYL